MIKNKKNKGVKGVFCAVFCVILAVIVFMAACTGCAAFDFSKVEVEPYDFAEYTQYAEDALIAAETSSSRSAVLGKANGVMERLSNIVTQYYVAYIRYCEDMQNSVREEQYSRIYGQYIKYWQCYLDVMLAIAKSPHEGVQSILTDEDKEYFLKQEALNSDEYRILQEIAHTIDMKYDELYYTTTVTVDNVTYGYSDVAEATKPLRNAWYKEYSSKAGDLLIELRDNNNKIATLAGYSGDYAAYAYENVFERDYSPTDAKALSAAVKTHFSGLPEELNKKQTDDKNYMKAAKSLIGWGDSVFADYFSYVSYDMSDAYKVMKDYNLLVQGKAAGAYTGAFSAYISGYGVPIIYQPIKEANNVGAGNIQTFLHEFGHFYASYYHNGGTNNKDINEIHSQANELLALKYWNQIITDPASYERATLERMARFSVQMGCVMDELQQIVYSDKTITDGSQVTAVFEGLLNEYGMGEFAPNYDSKYWWANVGHSFNSPFYYISYAVSAMPALDIYRISAENFDGAVQKYDKLVKLSDADAVFGELLDEAGLGSPFDEGTVREIASYVKSR